jgi:antibiotic biosynthesis monooxygenase (ABM) superfamily enzyme
MMLLQIYFDIPTEKERDFEKMYADSYVPAMQKQRGYLGSKLLRLFPPEIAEEIEAARTEFNYQMELMFDTEENRRLWVASEEHAAVWPLAEGMSRKVAWRGFDIVASDGSS